MCPLIAMCIVVDVRQLLPVGTSAENLEQQLYEASYGGALEPKLAAVRVVHLMQQTPCVPEGSPADSGRRHVDTCVGLPGLQAAGLAAEAGACQQGTLDAVPACYWVPSSHEQASLMKAEFSPCLWET